MAYLIQPCINVGGFPPVQEARRFTRNSLQSARDLLLPLGCPRRALNDFPLRGSFMSGGSSDKVGKWNGHIFFLQILLET